MSDPDRPDFVHRPSPAFDALVAMTVDGDQLGDGGWVEAGEWAAAAGLDGPHLVGAATALELAGRVEVQWRPGPGRWPERVRVCLNGIG